MPIVFLIAVSLAVFGIRAALHHSPAPTTRPDVTNPAPAKRYYRVRPGDTLTVVAANTGISVARLLRLNPKLQPTALFIGEKIRLR